MRDCLPCTSAHVASAGCWCVHGCPAALVMWCHQAAGGCACMPALQHMRACLPCSICVHARPAAYACMTLTLQHMGACPPCSICVMPALQHMCACPSCSICVHDLDPAAYGHRLQRPALSECVCCVHVSVHVHLCVGMPLGVTVAKMPPAVSTLLRGLPLAPLQYRQVAGGEGRGQGRDRRGGRLGTDGSADRGTGRGQVGGR